MSQAKLDKLRRRRVSTSAALSRLLDSGDWNNDELDAALDAYLKAFEEEVKYAFTRRCILGDTPDV